MRSDKFGSQLIEKVETGSLLSLMYMFPQKFRYFTDQNGPKRGPRDNEF